VLRRLLDERGELLRIGRRVDVAVGRGPRRVIGEKADGGEAARARIVDGGVLGGEVEAARRRLEVGPQKIAPHHVHAEAVEAIELPYARRGVERELVGDAERVAERGLRRRERLGHGRQIGRRQRLVRRRAGAEPKRHQRRAQPVAASIPHAALTSFPPE
jgi:hypothetical protein